jgi:hypothetical protein
MVILDLSPAEKHPPATVLMYLAVFFGESSRVATTGHKTFQDINAFAWMTLRLYEKLTLLGKFRLQVGRFSPRSLPHQWKERLTLHEIFATYCHFSHSGFCAVYAQSA